MNIFKKIYCRTFQEVMHIAIPFLPYRKPEILGDMSELANVLEKNGKSTVLLVTDKGVRGVGLTDDLEKTLKNAGIKCVVFDETIPNPTTDVIEKAAALYNKENCQALIGFGGGSSMDCAKAAAVRIAAGIAFHKNQVERI